MLGKDSGARSASDVLMTEEEYVKAKYGISFMQHAGHSFCVSGGRTTQGALPYRIEAVSALFDNATPHTPLGALKAFVTAYGRAKHGDAPEHVRRKVEAVRQKFFSDPELLDAVLLDEAVRRCKLPA